MRVSREVAEQNRAKVVAEASALFREHGYDGIGVAALMKAAGMTHGGFYKQFTDKSGLMVEATETALEDNNQKWAEILARDGLDGLTNWYLSAPHLDARAGGCCYAALAAEAPRQGEAVQATFAEALGKASELLEGEGLDRPEALSRIATMVGTLVLARAVGDDPLAQELLAAAKG